MPDLAIDHDLPGDPLAAFEALTNPRILRCWYGAGPGSFRVAASGGLADGATLTLALRDLDGREAAHAIALPTTGPGPQATLDLAWEGGPLDGLRLAGTLSFVATGAGTRAELRLAAPPSEAQAEALRAFWTRGLAQLARLQAGEVVSPYEELANEIQAYFDPLGVAAFTVLAGLREAGAPGDELAHVEDVLYRYLARLPAETAALLDAVMRERLAVLDGWQAPEPATDNLALTDR